MKIILLFGIITTLLMYVFFSFGNHSWNPMTWIYESIYWFGCLSTLGWIIGLLVVALEINKPIQDRRRNED